MTNKEEQSMNAISQKVKQWIDEKKDPRTAHWQGGLEAILDVFSPYLEPGKLIPVKPLEEDDISVFRDALEFVDLSPKLIAAFLPPSIAGSITPPESAEELQRIDKDKPSYKILIARPGTETRLLCAEISEHAKNPGIDIFESGTLLGNYNYTTVQDCFAFLTLAIRAHIWEKAHWRPDDHKRYTINWFEKTLDLRKGTVRVNEGFSYFHSPTLIKSDRIDAMFTLIFDIFLSRINDPNAPVKKTVSSIRNNENKDFKLTQAFDFSEKMILELLNVMKELALIKVEEFSNPEKERFKNEFSRTAQKISDRIIEH